MDLADKVVVITGAGRGIGRATALRFVEGGAKLALVARTQSQLDSVAREVQSLGGTAVTFRADVSREEEVASLARRVEEDLGPVDILINNAGILVLRRIVDMTVAEWEEVMGANLRSVFLCARAFLPSMMRRRSGRIINVGSTAGRRGYPEQGVYCASKHGLNGLSKVLALEAHSYGIRVNVVSPGGVLTDLSSKLRESRGKVDPAEWMTAEEVAEAIWYLAAQEGAATTDELALRRFASEPWR